MPERERPVEAPALPASLAPLVEGYQWAQSTIGESGDAVYRLHRADAGVDLYLKHGRGPCALDLAGEMVRLRWLESHIPAPAVRHFTASPDEAWLLMTALPGETAYQALEARPAEQGALVDALAAFLRRLHAIPVENCPFNSDHRLRLGEARWRLDAGMVDTGDFDADHQGWTGEQVWDEIAGLLPFPPDPAVTHGDVSLDNIIVADGVVVGCIDVGRAGIADRYQDLAILWHCLGDFGPALQNRFLAAYGIAETDERKVRFHILLDELF
jgi:aminoglycoside 3'-phosphotransferase-1